MRGITIVTVVLAAFAVASPAQAQMSFGAARAVGDDDVFIDEPGNMIEPGVVYGWNRSRVLSDARDLPPILNGGIPCEHGMAGIFPCDNVDVVSLLPVSKMGGGRGATAPPSRWAMSPSAITPVSTSMILTLETMSCIYK